MELKDLKCPNCESSSIIYQDMLKGYCRLPNKIIQQSHKSWRVSCGNCLKELPKEFQDYVEDNLFRIQDLEKSAKTRALYQAAPDLLKALKTMQEAFDTFTDFYHKAYGEIDMLNREPCKSASKVASEAIAKAEGKS